MSVLYLLANLKKLDVRVELADEQLKLSAPEGVLTSTLINELKEKKTEIIEFLKNNVQTQLAHTTIKPAVERDYYPLSFAQNRLYFLQQMDLQSTVYNMLQIVELGEYTAIDLEKLEETCKKLIQRHEALRTSFEMLADNPVQKIHDHVPFEIEHYECPADKAGDFGQQAIRDFVRPFNLAKPPLLRVGLLKTGEGRTVLLVDIHHIISDGFSIKILVNDFMSLYKGEDLTPLKLQYKDYTEWQLGEQQRVACKEQEAYWISEFFGDIPVLSLPTDFPRPLIQSFEGTALSFEVPAKETAVLMSLASEKGATSYMVLLAVFNILMSKLSGQEDVIVGTPVAGRGHADLQNIIGLFVNTLPMRNYPSGKKTFKEFLQEVKERTLEAFENQEYQFEDLVEKVAPRRDASRNPLFDVMFALQNIGENTETVSQVNVPQQTGNYSYRNRVSRFDMNWAGVEIGNRLFFGVEYCTKLFKEERILQFIDFFKKIIASIIENPGANISEIGIISEDEKKKILLEFNDTGREFPVNKVIHELYQEQAGRAPDNTAVVYRDKQLTYKELNESANRLAWALREKGVKPGSIVGIMAERSLEAIVSLFAVLKAGGAYLPIDPSFPEDRRVFILDDSSAQMVLSSVPARQGISGKCQVMVLGEMDLNTFQASNPDRWNTVQDLAYVLYTSGSTGKPKGVMIEHRSVINLLYGLWEFYPMIESDRYLMKTSFLFDVSVTEFFGWFSGGSCVVLLENEGEKDPYQIIDTIAGARITHINFVPTMFNAFLHAITPRNIVKLSSLKFIFLAGEAFFINYISILTRLGRNIRWENVYGPTEGTVYASKYSITHWVDRGRISIGKPLPNVQLYILDRYGHVQPVGVVGELCIAGAGLARGYLNNQELTADKFIPNPFAEGEKLYRTGDQAKWMADGNIEFLGRLDNQVKIRGFRIELGEIENQLLTHENIKEAVVLLKGEGGNKSLCAYIVSDTALEKSTLRAYLSGKLPAYMVPSHFVPMERIPLTASGKIDRKSLPEPELGGPAHPYVAPQDEIEKKLTGIWSEILEIEKEKISVEANFFELGGNSLNLIMVVSKINREFGIEVPISQIYNKPLIREIAKSIKSKNFTDQEVILLHQLRPKKVFCFPPQVAYGVSYLRLAFLINDYSFYSFTFIEQEDRLDRYVKHIKDIQPEGPYILFGHSAAGPLAFEVAKALEDHGNEVSDIIFGDCGFPDESDMGRERPEAYFDAYYELVDNFLDRLGATFLRDKVMEKTKKYMGYYFNVTHLEVINAHVHSIISDEAQLEQKKRGFTPFERWAKFTTKPVEMYIGVGTHMGMFEEAEYVEKNAEVIRKILQEIESRN